MTSDTTSEKCPVCGRSGSRVRPVTKAMVMAALRLGAPTGHRFAMDDYTAMRPRLVAAMEAVE